MKNYVLRTGLLLACPLWATSMSTVAAAQSSLQLIGVDVTARGSNRTIRIRTNGTPTYTVFRLSDPMRVVVDLSATGLGQLRGPLVYEDGIVGQIALREFNAPPLQISRVMVGFEAACGYSIRTEGQDVVVTSELNAGASPAPTGTGGHPANGDEIGASAAAAGGAAAAIGLPRPVASAANNMSVATEPPMGDPTEATYTPKSPKIEQDRDDVAVVAGNKAPAAANARPPEASLLNIVRQDAQTYLLRLEGAYVHTISQLHAPERLVVDLDGTRRQVPQRLLNFGGPWLRRVRLGDHEGAVRAVFDLASSRVVGEVTVVPAGLRIRLGPRPSAPAIGASADAPRASLAGGSTQPLGGRAALHNVRFDPGVDGAARITLDVRGGAVPRVRRQDDQTWVLTVPDAEVAAGLQRTLDTSAYDTPLRAISTFQADDGHAHVVARLAQAAEFDLHRRGDQWLWDLRPSEAAGGASRPVARPGSAGRGAGVRQASLTSQVASGLARLLPGQSRESQKRISIDVKDADIINVLRLISEETGENIVASDEVKGKVTLKLRNVPADQALDTILRTKGFDRVRQNNILRIAPAEAIQRERDLELAKKRSQAEVEETLIKMVTVNYATAAEILDQIKPMLSGRGSVQVDARTNTIIMQDIASNIDRLVELTRRLDKQTPLVMIQARIVEAQTTHLQDLGIQWGGSAQRTARTGNPTGLVFPGDVIANGAADTPTANQVAGISTPGHYAVNLPAQLAGTGAGIGLILGSAGGNDILNLRLSAMETNGTGKVISSPEVATLDNKTARVSQGVEIPISVVSAAGNQTRFIPAVLELEVTPHVTNDGTVLLKIKTQKSEPDFTRKGAAGDPTIQKKYAETEVLVRDGDTSVIGGIYTRTTTETYSEVPLLSRIPLLGNLFRQHRSQDDRAELLIFITPRIINREESMLQNSSLNDPPTRDDDAGQDPTE